MKIGVVMDPIEGINIRKDSTFAMLLAAQSRGWEIFYMKTDDLYLTGNSVYADMKRIHVEDNPEHWFKYLDSSTDQLSRLDAVLMRKDPPVDLEYFYTTYLLELVQKQGVVIINDPVSLRDVNEKMFISWFPQCIAPTMVTRNKEKILSFMAEHKDIILKPLNAMGGHSVFHVKSNDKNTNVIIETLTGYGKKSCMAQAYIPEIIKGDKRILLINGKPVPYALARLPNVDEHRANLVVGGKYKSMPLSDRDLWICEQIKPVLVDKGLIFTGIDVIGDFLTEINVTSPTCIRELDKSCNLDIAGQLMDELELIINS